MYPLLLILVLHTSSEAFSSTSTLNLDNCLDKFSIQYCSKEKNDRNFLWHLSNLLNQHFTLVSENPCANLGFSFRWVIKDFASEKVVAEFEEYKRRSILFINARLFPRNPYILELEVTHPQTKRKKLIQCFIRMKLSHFDIFIYGRRLKRSKLQLTVATSCKDGRTLTYKWSCIFASQDIDQSRLSECEDEHDKQIAITWLPHELPNNMAEVLVSDGEQDRRDSGKYARPTDNTISIHCRQNCHLYNEFYLKPNMTAVFEAVCSGDACTNIRTFEWNVENAMNQHASSYNNSILKITALDDKDETWAYFYPIARNAENGVLKLHLLEKGRMYTLTYKTVLSDCKAFPDDIYPIITVVNVKCQKFARTENHNRIWRDVTIKVVELINGTFPLTLSRNIVPDFLIRFGSAIPVYEVVNATLDTLRTKPLEDIQIHNTIPLQYGDIFNFTTEVYHNNVPECQWPGALGKEGRVWEAVQIINSLMTKLLEQETESRVQFNTQFSTTLLMDMLMFPTDMVLDSLIFVLLRLIRPLDEPKQLSYSLQLSNVCSHLAAKLNEELHSDNRYFKDIVAFKAHTVLAQCDFYLMTYNYQTDDWPMNKNDLSRHNAITNNIVAMTKTLSLIQFTIPETDLNWTAPLNEKEHFIQQTTASRINRTIDLDRCEIELPLSIGFNDEELVTLVVNAFKEHVFYVHNITESLNTKVVKLSIDGNQTNVSNFSSEANVFLDTVSTSSSDQPLNDTVSEEKPSLYNDTNIPVFIIEKISFNSLLITIANISEPIRIVLLDKKRPVLSDFEASQSIINQTTLQIEESDQDGWIFLGILPEAAFSQMIVHDLSKSNTFRKTFAPVPALNKSETSIEDSINKSEEITVDLSMIQQRCLHWTNDNWNHIDCKIGPKSTLSNIHCKCYSLDSVGGFSLAPNFKRKDVLVLSLIFTYRPNYIPVIVVNLIFACYCIAMCFTLIRGSFKEQIYYLGDNLHTHNYAYFIIARTSDKSFAGTTANIVIQLFGEKAKSRPHVLNYPDPNQNLMQRGNKDCFILTARQHLGDLKRIKMWSDCLQLRPTWRCDYVKICDLQTKTWYMFDVNTLFSPLKNGKHFISVTGVEMTRKYRKRLTVARLMGAFIWGSGQSHSWNIFSRKYDQIFDYKEKLTVMLCTIMTSCSVVLWICNDPKFHITDAIYNKKNLNRDIIYQYALVTSCILFAVNRIFVVTFRNLNRQAGYRYTYKKRILPQRCKFVCWVFMVLLIIANILYVLCMGHGISPLANYSWLIITFLSLVISIIIWENVYAGIHKAMRLKRSSNVSYHYNEIIKESQKQKDYLKQVIPGHYSLRPYLVHLYAPMSAERYNRKRNEVNHRIQIAKTFRDFCFFLLYFTLLYCLVGLNLDSQRILLNNHMKEMILGKLNFNNHKVKSLDQLLEYLNDTFTTTIHSPVWYGNFTIGEPKLMRGVQTKILGVVRIRQQRVITIPCEASEFCYTVFGITKCASQYLSSHEDYQNYSNTVEIWQYQTSSETGYTAYHGQFATYYGGGFITYTGVTLPETQKNIMDMVKEKWLDKLTRAILIEFWAYNANRNLFSIVTLTFEFSSTGYVEKSHVIYSTSLLYGTLEQEITSIIVFAIFFFVIMYQLGSLMYDMVTQKAKFWSALPNWFFIVLWIANAVVIGLNVRKQYVIESIVNDLDTKKEGEFTLYFEAEYICTIYTVTIAVLMCASVMGTWRFLRFGFTFGVFEHTIRKLTTSLLGITIYSLLVFLKYSIISSTLFGSYVWIFRDIVSTMKAVTLLSLKLYKGYDHMEIELPLPVASKLFYSGYQLTLVYFLTVYISIIMQNYKFSKKTVSSRPPQISIFSYFKEECLYQFAYFKRKKKHLAAGENDDKYLYDRPKVINKVDNEEEGDGVVNIPSNKFEFMAIMLLGCIYNKFLREDKGVVTSYDIHIMQSVIWYFQHMEEGEQLPYYQMKINENCSHFISKSCLDDLIVLVNRLCDPEALSEDRHRKQSKKSITDKISLKKLSLIADSLRIADTLLENIQVKKSSEVPINFDNSKV